MDINEYCAVVEKAIEQQRDGFITGYELVMITAKAMAELDLATLHRDHSKVMPAPTAIRYV